MAAALELATERPIGQPKTPFFSQSLSDNERGRLMEHRVASVLLGLDVVKLVIVNPKLGEQDQLGRDLTVHLENGLPMSMVWVQVKSSPKGTYEYLRHRGKKLRQIGDDRSVREWMTANRQILINGAKEDDMVMADFNAQLAAIQLTHRNMFNTAF